MKKSVCLSGLAVAFLGLGIAYGQEPVSTPGGPPAVPSAEAQPAQSNPPPLDPYAHLRSGPPPYSINRGGVDAPAPPGQPPVVPPGLSSWLTYPRAPGCCGPVGRHGHISTEVYMRTGVSFPVGGGIFGDVLHTGWAIQGGARVLFFDPPAEAAWTVDLSISNINYNATNSNRQATLRNFEVQSTDQFGQPTTTVIPEFDVTVSGLNQTFVNLALGREWYLWGQGVCNGQPNLRWGVDGGGRWGTAKLDLNEIRHRTDTIGGIFGSVHADFEYPCGACILQAGVRGEYGVTWSNILQSQNDTDLQAINLLFTFGVRY